MIGKGTYEEEASYTSTNDVETSVSTAYSGESLVSGSGIDFDEEVRIDVYLAISLFSLSFALFKTIGFAFSGK